MTELHKKNMTELHKKTSRNRIKKNHQGIKFKKNN